jgi:serine phosphatase RsbU (regulator of sigma subunit)
MLQPAYEVAGDSFDYARDTGGMHVVVIDSVGHDLDSSLISHLVQGSLRNSRRNGLDITEAYSAADEALSAMFPDPRFATAAFGGSNWRAVGSAGSRRGIRRRCSCGADGSSARRRPCRPSRSAWGAGTTPVNEVVLERGDALLFYTDGVTEGGARGGERFGLDRLVDLLGRTLLAGLQPAELLRRLVTAVLEHTAYELHDDTTLLLVQRRDGKA